MFRLKKIVVAVILVCIFFSVINTVFAATITLDQIVEKINSSNYGEFFIKEINANSLTGPVNMTVTINSEVARK